MRIVTFTAIAALIVPSPAANVAHGQGCVDGGTVIDTFPSLASNTSHGRGVVDGAGSVFVLLSDPSDIAHAKGQVDAAGSVGFATSYSADVYGRGVVDGAGSVGFATSESADVYGRGQVDAAESAVSVVLTSESADVYGRGQVDAAESAVAVGSTFTYASDGDTNDLFYFIGKNYDNAGTWTNPHTAGRVTVSYSSTGSGSFAALVDRASNYLLYTNSAVNSWFAVDFGAGKTIAPSYYSVRHDGETGYYLRTWKLQGSNDVVPTVNLVTSWTDLDTRTSDTTINAPDAWGSWAVTGSSGYRWLRVVQTGANSNGSDYLVFGEFQVYGTFI